jgi:large conductance mechanosensitive channel
MGLLREFREFAVKGNVIDLAVGIIIGAAFTGIVNSLVNDIVMPPIGAIVGRVDFSNLAITLIESDESPAKGATPPPAATPAVPAAAAATRAPGAPVQIRYGRFLQAVLNFLIVAGAVFLLVKAINQARRRMERKAEENPTAPEVPADVRLLTEIRDELRRRPAGAA